MILCLKRCSRGLEHERQYVESLEGAGRCIVNVAAITDRTEAVARTVTRR
jgi:hypothetical protein